MFRAELTSDQLSEIFDRSIRSDLEVLRARSADVEPTLILVGAQPGAGKTLTVARARHAHPGAVPVIGDDLRAFHPDYLRVMREDPLRMPEVTAQAAGAWARMASDHLRERRVSVVFETTFRQPDAVVATTKEFRDAGYRVEVRALAVPEAVSRLGVLSRYAEQVRDHGAGRWTPQVIHDAAVAQMPASLERVIGEGLVDRVLVVDRAGRQLHAADIPAVEHTGSARNRHGREEGGDAQREAVAVADRRRAQEAGRAAAAVHAGRQADTLTSQAASTWLTTLHHDAAFVIDHAERSEDVLQTIDRLRSDGEGLADRAHGLAGPQRLEAGTQLERLGAQVTSARTQADLHAGTSHAGLRNRQPSTQQLPTQIRAQLSTELRPEPGAPTLGGNVARGPRTQPGLAR